MKEHHFIKLSNKFFIYISSKTISSQYFEKSLIYCRLLWLRAGMTKRKLSRCLPLWWSFSWCVGPHITFILYSPTITHQSWGHPILVISTSPSTGWQCLTHVSILLFITTWTKDFELTSTKFFAAFHTISLKLLKLAGQQDLRAGQILLLRSIIVRIGNCNDWDGFSFTLMTIIKDHNPDNRNF